MICPKCGYDIGNKSKCVRCGYEIKTLAVVDENNSNDEPKKEEKTETKVIDPCNVYLTHPYGYEDDYDTGFGPGGDPFASLFDDLFGDPISDLLGGLFGINVNPFGGSSRRTYVRESEEPPKKKKKQGPIVEVNDVEIIEDEPKNKDRTQQQERREEHRERHERHGDPGHSGAPHKNKFRRRPDR